MKLSILIPVINEAENIPIMLKILGATVSVPYEILIIHDTPDDNSVPVVNSLNYPNVRLIHNTIGKGVANALRAGISASKGEYILIFAVDEVGPVLAIDNMISLMDEGCDLVSATRYAYGGRRLGGSPIGQILSRIGNKAFNLLSGSTLSDCTTGIKMIRRSIVANRGGLYNINFESTVGWAVAFEIAVKAQAFRLNLGEVPIISIDRLYGGKSTFNSKWLKCYLHWFFWGLKNIPRGQRPPITISHSWIKKYTLNFLTVYTDKAYTSNEIYNNIPIFATLKVPFYELVETLHELVAASIIESAVIKNETHYIFKNH